MDTPIIKPVEKPEEKAGASRFKGDPMLVSPKFLRTLAKGILKQGEGDHDLPASWAKALLAQYPE